MDVLCRTGAAVAHSDGVAHLGKIGKVAIRYNTFMWQMWPNKLYSLTKQPIFAVVGIGSVLCSVYLDKLRGKVYLAVDVGEDEVGVGRVEGDGEGDGGGPEEHHGEDGRRRLHLGHRV